MKDRLKRYDEYLLVKEVTSNPRFVEDVVRYAAKLFYEEYGEALDPDTRVVFEAISEESIHPFNTYAYLETSLRELRRVIKT